MTLTHRGTFTYKVTSDRQQTHVSVVVNPNNSIERNSKMSPRPYDRIVILYGSETGNAQDLAKIIAWTLSKLDASLELELMCFDEYPMTRLPTEKFVLFICSTTGIGEEPQNMKKFWRFLLRRDLPSDSLKSLQFAVIGLGDSSYQKYNFVSKKLHKRLLTLGGESVLDLVLGDDQHELGPFSSIDPWLKAFYLLVAPGGDLDTKSDILIKPSFVVSSAADFLEIDAPVPSSKVYTSVNPYISQVKSNVRVTSSDHFQDVRVMSLAIDNTRLSYKLNDVCVIFPNNNDEDVETFLSMFTDDAYNFDRKFGLQLNSNCWISKQSYYHHLLAKHNPCSVQHLVKYYLDIRSIPKRSFFELFSHFSQNELERDKLQRFASGEDLDELYDYVNRPKRTILEVMLDFPNTTPHVPFEYVFDLIPAISGRPYSIASSPLVSPSSIDVLYAVIKYNTRLRKPRLGLCTNWLAGLDVDHSVSIYIRSSSFRLPSSHVPLIMIAAGTGVAPFRAFIQDRAHRALGDNYLFFGCRNREHDYYLRDEWSPLIDQGLLQVFTAFSREDPNKKFYVQHRLWQERSLVHRLLIDSEGYLLVSGKSEQYPQLVRETIVNIVEEFCSKSSEGIDDAEALVNRLELKRRIQFECW